MLETEDSVAESLNEGWVPTGTILGSFEAKDLILVVKSTSADSSSSGDSDSSSDSTPKDTADDKDSSSDKEGSSDKDSSSDKDDKNDKNNKGGSSDKDDRGKDDKDGSSDKDSGGSGNQEPSFTGSAETGAKVFGQLTRLAVKSPFELRNITNSAKQL